MNAVRSWLVDVLVPVYRPVERIALEFWAVANIKLRRKESIDNSGKYRRYHTLFAARVLDAFMRDPQWRTLVVQKSSQSGFTLHVLILICRCIAELAVNVLYVIDTLANARRISNERLKPMLEDCKATKDLVCEDNSKLKTLEYSFPECTLALVGSNSVGAVANMSAAVIACDEMAKYKKPKKESSIFLLAMNRMKNVEGGKGLGFSSPTWEDDETSQGYQSGSRHRYFVPCPHCGTMQTIEWDRICFDHCKMRNGDYDQHRVLKETYLRCENRECLEPILEDHKPEMMMRGEIRPTNFKEIIDDDGNVVIVPGWGLWEMSFQISDLYSLFTTATWGIIAVEFIKAQGRPKKLVDWTNGRMGQPVRHSISNITAELVSRLIAFRGQPGEYTRGTLPLVPNVGVGAIDSQGDFKKCVKGAFVANGTFYVSDWYSTSTMEEARLWMEKPMIAPGGREIPVQRVICDEGGKGGNTYEVRSFCFGLWPKYVVCKGRGGIQVQKDTVWWTKSRVTKGGSEEMPICHYDDDTFKSILYLQRIKKHSEWRTKNLDKPRLWLPADTDDEFIRELCGEQLQKTVDDYGNATVAWKSYPPNDYGDGVKMCHVLWNNIEHQFRPQNPPGPPAEVAKAA